LKKIESIREVNDSYAEIGYSADILNLNKPGSLIRIASMTTALARCKLISNMLIIGAENIIYSDTDSIVFYKKFLPKL
jgi:hypothetical protein